MNNTGIAGGVRKLLKKNLQNVRYKAEFINVQVTHSSTLPILSS